MLKKIVKNAFAFCLGVFITLLLLEIFLRGLGWYQTNRSLFTKITVKNKNEIRILSLGDSMTALGENPCYPEQLQGILSKSLPNKNITVFNEGVVQASSGNILFNLEKNLDKYKPDIVTIMIGSNDYGSVKYEESAGIKSSDFLSNLKVYKLYKYLLKGIQDKLDKIAIFHPKDTDLISLGNDSFQKGQISAAKNYFEKALQINPNNDQADYGLGIIYHNNGEINKALIYFKKAITVNPNNYEAYIQLGNNSGNNESLDKKIWYFQQAIKINPKNPKTYFQLTYLYHSEHMYKQELEVHQQMSQIINHNSSVILMSPVGDYIKKNRITEAINTINKVFTLESHSQLLYIQLLAELYKSQGKTKEAEKALALLTKSNGALAQNYMKMADILKKRGIILVAVQYPMRDISPLKTILKDTDAVFVDNEKSFKEKVSKYGPDRYFVDNFGGNFGHLTKEGHRIVAENIANILLKEIFKTKK